MLQVKTAISSTKEDKATTQILNLNTKTIEDSFGASNGGSNGSEDFVPLFLQCGQHLNTVINVFLSLSKVSVLAHFQESML